MRERLLNDVFSAMDRTRVHVLTGVRGSGKHTFLEGVRARLLERGVAEDQLIEHRFDDFGMFEGRYLGDLPESVKARIPADRPAWIFLDEVQTVSDIDSVLENLARRKNLRVFAIAQGLHLVDKLPDLRQCREIRFLPRSFCDFVELTGTASELRGAFSRYRRRGGLTLPGGDADFEGEAQCLEGVLCSILLRDVIGPAGISDAKALSKIVRLLCRDVGFLRSPRAVGIHLRLNGFSTDEKTVDRYLRALVESGLFIEIGRFDIAHEQDLPRMKKYYPVDPGIVDTALASIGLSEEDALETVILVELLRRRCDVRFGRLGSRDDGEVDFVVRDTSGVKYIQVAGSGCEEAERKLQVLSRIRAEGERMLLTLEEVDAAAPDGIVRMNALEWLLAEDVPR